jgi:nucleoside-diphosphate-sugar epimerase
MIIGRGLVAKSFQDNFFDNDDILVFASGVSNSGDFNPSNFARERKLLEESISLKKFLIYFSTCSVHDVQVNTSPYVQHKLFQEKLIINSCAESGYAIFRLPQLVGRNDNPHTITNFLYSKIMTEKKFEVWRFAKRNLIDIQDVVFIISHMMNSGNKEYHNSITNVASPNSVEILSIINIFENILNKKANINIIDKGSEYMIEATNAIKVAADIGINFDASYVEKILRKYYEK